MKRTTQGAYFEDYFVGQDLIHATPRTVTDGDRALYTGLYPSRFAFHSSDAFAASLGLERAPVDDLITFHTVFGKTVPDISLNAVANLGYADGRFLRPVYPGDTLRSRSEVIGVKENSNGKTGIVWVRTTGFNQRDEEVLTYCRWVMVNKRDPGSPAPDPVVPDLPASVGVESLVPLALNLSGYDTDLAGSPEDWDAFDPGQHIDHVDGVTLTDAEHMMATRLWQNTAKVHFNIDARPDGRRLIYGGHIISMARALSFNGMENAQWVLGVNAGSHANPAFAGDTVYAGTTVLEKAELPGSPLGALRVRLIAAKAPVTSAEIRGDDGKYRSDILLDLDLWLGLPRL